MLFAGFINRETVFQRYTFVNRKIKTNMTYKAHGVNYGNQYNECAQRAKHLATPQYSLNFM